MYQTSKMVVVAVVVVLGLLAHHMAQADEAIKPDQLPKAVQARIAKMFPKAEIIKAEKEDEGGVTLYEAKLKTKKGVLEIVTAEDGALVEIETRITAAQLPKAVKAAVEKKAKGAKIVKCEKMELHAEVRKGKLVALKKPKVEYEVKYKVGDKVVEIKTTADGKVIEDEDEEDEEDEQKLTLGQVPAAVKATILKEAGNNKLKEIELETEDGKKVYEAEWVVGGKKTEIKVAPDGKLLKKEVESADKDDDDDDDEDDDKDDDEDEDDDKDDDDDEDDDKDDDD